MTTCVQYVSITYFFKGLFEFRCVGVLDIKVKVDRFLSVFHITWVMDGEASFVLDYGVDAVRCV